MNGSKMGICTSLSLMIFMLAMLNFVNTINCYDMPLWSDCSRFLIHLIREGRGRPKKPSVPPALGGTPYTASCDRWIEPHHEVTPHHQVTNVVGKCAEEVISPSENVSGSGSSSGFVTLRSLPGGWRSEKQKP